MKPNYLFTSMLALTTIVVASCSVPRLAQQSTNDDVYNSVAQAKEYSQQVPVRDAAPEEVQDDDYGTSDPYYDMDYSSRINRFSYANPSWRGYYDPYFDGGWYGNYGLSLGLGFGLSPFYGSIWNAPYNGWGNYYSPFWGYNNWGYNNYYGGGYYGGGYYGGGYFGGGYYTGRTTNVEDYRPRPSRGSSGYTGTRGAGNTDYLSPRSRANTNGSSTGRPTRSNVNNGQASRPTTESSRPSRTESTRPARTENVPTRTESTRPTRESYTPPPSYSPPPSRSSGGGSGGGSYGRGSSGGGGGGGRPSRGGR